MAYYRRLMCKKYVMNINVQKKEKETDEPSRNLIDFADYFEALSFVMIADFFLAALFL